MDVGKLSCGSQRRNPVYLKQLFLRYGVRGEVSTVFGRMGEVAGG